MLIFDPRDPYPLRPAGSHTYAEAQAHSQAVDEWLGLGAEAIERDLVERGSGIAGQQLWVGLPVRAMLTPYTEIREILSRLNPATAQSVVDLGAGYGRMGFVIGRHYPEVRFIGYEFVKERVEEAQRCLAPLNHSRVEMRVADLNAEGFTPEKADFYFIYDFGTREAIHKTLEDLRKIARDRPIVVVGRGRAARDAIERGHPWLSQVIEPEHFGHYSVYRTSI